MKLLDIPFFFHLDIESYGLYGSSVAYGYVVTDFHGGELDFGSGKYLPKFSSSPFTDKEDENFFRENVLPALSGIPEASGPLALKNDCFAKWEHWRSLGAHMVTDCGYPVETNFLSASVRDLIEKRKWLGPYPLIEASTLSLLTGKDPLVSEGRTESEFPIHNPLCDARQSARVFHEHLSQMVSLLPWFNPNSA